VLIQQQVGIPLELDIGVIDVNTCEPLEDVLISLWVCVHSHPISRYKTHANSQQHCNATGSYSSFAGNDPNVSFGDLIAEKNITINGTFGQDLSVSPVTILEEVDGARLTGCHG
jgi:hypothetical protein